MGLIILPLMMLWFVAAIYAIRMGYHLISAHPFMPFGLPLILIALICMGAYIYLGLASFKGNKEIWAFEIPFFFMAGKLALTLFSVSFMVNFFFAKQIQNEYILACLFIVMITLSSGALIGSFNSESFIQKNNIKVTH
jgi:hypothetical protein